MRTLVCSKHPIFHRKSRVCLEEKAGDWLQLDCSELGRMVPGKLKGLVDLRSECREVSSCGVLSSSLSKEGREKGFLESSVHVGLFAD